MIRLLIVLVCLLGDHLQAEPFAYPKYTKVVGSINWGKSYVETGDNSRVEIRFVDGTTVRVGTNSKLRWVPGTRMAVLDGGSLLVSLPKDAGGILLYSGSVVVTTAEGDFELSNVAGYINAICLTGVMDVKFTSNLKQRKNLKYGQMVSLAPGIDAMPRPVVVNLKTLIETGNLMKMGDLPNQVLIDRNAGKQKGPSPIAVPGVNNNIMTEAQMTTRIADNEQLQRQQSIADQLALAQELAEKQKIAQQQQATAQQQAAQLQVEKQAKIAADAEAVRLQQQANQGNQGNAFGPGGNQGQGNQGNKDHVPPGQAKKQ